MQPPRCNTDKLMLCKLNHSRPTWFPIQIPSGKQTSLLKMAIWIGTSSINGSFSMAMWHYVAMLNKQRLVVLFKTSKKKQVDFPLNNGDFTLPLSLDSPMPNPHGFRTFAQTIHPVKHTKSELENDHRNSWFLPILNMVNLSSSLCKSFHFPVVFLWFSYGLPVKHPEKAMKIHQKPPRFHHVLVPRKCSAWRPASGQACGDSEKPLEEWDNMR